MIIRPPFRCPRAFDSSPVDPFQKHRELGATQPYNSALRLRPDEAAALQPLGKQTQTVAIPPQQLDDIASSPSEHKDVSGERLFSCSCNTFCTCALSPSNPRRRSVTPAAIQTLVPTGSWITGEGSPAEYAVTSDRHRSPH